MGISSVKEVIPIRNTFVPITEVFEPGPLVLSPEDEVLRIQLSSIISARLPPHLEVQCFVSMFKIEPYGYNFETNGFTDLSYMARLTQRDLEIVQIFDKGLQHQILIAGMILNSDPSIQHLNRSRPIPHCQNSQVTIKNIMEFRKKYKESLPPPSFEDMQQTDETCSYSSPIPPIVYPVVPSFPYPPSTPHQFEAVSLPPYPPVIIPPTPLSADPTPSELAFQPFYSEGPPTTNPQIQQQPPIFALEIVAPKPEPELKPEPEPKPEPELQPQPKPAQPEPEPAPEPDPNPKFEPAPEEPKKTKEGNWLEKLFSVSKEELPREETENREYHEENLEQPLFSVSDEEIISSLCDLGHDRHVAEEAYLLNDKNEMRAMRWLEDQ